METYEFNKSLSDRFEELSFILACNECPVQTAEVNSLWSHHMEIMIEPTGWQAIWSISRVICEELNIKYPTIVFGTVENVDFKELKSVFKISAVQDDEIHLPEVHEVPLTELWVTKIQEIEELNIERTAECIDQLRFFYTHIYMPWDCDETFNWTEKLLSDRLNFYYDLKSKNNDRSVSSYIRNLLEEVKYLQQRREYLELGMSDDEDDDETVVSNGVNKNVAVELMSLHLRLNNIKYEIEVLQNPEMRKDFLAIKFNRPIMEKATNCFLVLQQGDLDEQIKFLEMAKSVIGTKNDVMTCSSFQEALNISNYSDLIYLSPGEHKVKFLESFNSGGAIKGITTNPLKKSENPVILSKNQELILFTIDGDFRLENVSLDCSNVSTGLLVRSGHVTLKNCRIFDGKKSPAKHGIKLIGDAVLELIDCEVANFSIGISMKSPASLQLKNNSLITDCEVGIACEDTCKLQLSNATVRNSSSRGIFYETSLQDIQTQNKVVYNDFTQLPEKLREFIVATDNFKFENNSYGNFVIVKKMMLDQASKKNGKNGVRRSILTPDEDDGTEEMEHESSCDDFHGFTDAIDDHSVIILNDTVDEEVV